MISSQDGTEDRRALAFFLAPDAGRLVLGRRRCRLGLGMAFAAPAPPRAPPPPSLLGPGPGRPWALRGLAPSPSARAPVLVRPWAWPGRAEAPRPSAAVRGEVPLPGRPCGPRRCSMAAVGAPTRPVRRARETQPAFGRRPPCPRRRRVFGGLAGHRAGSGRARPRVTERPGAWRGGARGDDAAPGSLRRRSGQARSRAGRLVLRSADRRRLVRDRRRGAAGAAGAVPLTCASSEPVQIQRAPPQ